MPRPMPAASRAVGAFAIRRCTAGAAPNFAAWYRCSEVGKDHGPATIGKASGWKLLNSPQASRVNRKPQASSRLYIRMPSSSVTGAGSLGPSALRPSASALRRRAGEAARALRWTPGGRPPGVTVGQVRG